MSTLTNTAVNFSSRFAPVTARIFLALIFVVSGYSKIGAYEGTQGYMEMMGVPGLLLPAVIIFEIGAGLAIILGWQARLAALGLAGFSVISAVVFHANFADQIQSIMFMKNVAIAGGFLMIVAHGAGAFSLDNRAKRDTPAGAAALAGS